MESRQRLSDIITGYMPARAVQVAAHLGLPDLVREGVASTPALSQAVGIDAWRLGRFMRYLVAVGVFRKTDDFFEVTDLGSFLCKENSETLRDLAVHNYYGFDAWTKLEQALKTQKSGYELSTGRSYFEAINATPEFATAFDRAMNAMFVPENRALIEKYDFGQYSFLMDVGGGNGEVLILALQANPDLSACLFDLTHVVDRAASRIADADLEDRCERIGGSFFDPLPRKSEAILLRHILHNWQEDDVLLILKRCRDALEPGGVLLIGEAIIEDADSLNMGIRLDLSMLTYFDGAERTLDEYRELLGKADLEVTGVVPITPALSIIEAQAT